MAYAGISNKDVAQLVKHLCREHSWSYSHTGTSHVRLHPPFGGTPVIVSLTSRGSRLVKNVRQDIRMVCRVAGQQSPV